MRSILLGLLATCLAGCSGGPATTDTSSSSLPALEDRVELLQQHVTFRRSYQELEFHISFRNGGSFPPAPSEWDVRLVARVPPGELEHWIPEGVKPVTTTDTSWLDSVPQSEKATGITEWYVEHQRIVGVDRGASIVAWRIWKY